MGFLPAGAPVPLQMQLPIEDGSQFVRATVVDSNNTALLGSPVAMPYFAKGNYNSSAFLMPNIPWIKAIYEVFTDSGYTTLSPAYGETSEVFYLEQAGGGGGGNPAQSPRLVGVIGQTEDGPVQCAPCSKPYDIYQGSSSSSDVVFNILFLDQDTKLPFDLTAASAIQAKFLNADGSFLTLSLSGGLSILSPAVLGQVQVTIEAAETALLQYGMVSMEIVMVVAGSTYVVQFPYQLNIHQPVFN